MSLYRFAILNGNGPCLSACSVRSHLTLTATSYREALKFAARLNALIVAYYPAKGAQA